MFSPGGLENIFIVPMRVDFLHPCSLRSQHFQHCHLLFVDGNQAENMRENPIIISVLKIPTHSHSTGAAHTISRIKILLIPDCLCQHFTPRISACSLVISIRISGL